MTRKVKFHMTKKKFTYGWWTTRVHLTRDHLFYSQFLTELAQGMMITKN